MPIARPIPLTRGQYAWVDAEDYERVSQYKWRAQVDNDTKDFVAVSKVGLMSRFIFGVTDPKILVDHKNHNKLDNRKLNLRIANNFTNGYNRLKNKNNVSGHKGVYRHSNGIGWIFQINAGGTRYREYFKNLEEAVAARKEAVIRLHGEFACDND